jgi:serine/threonine protein kinase
VFSAGQIVGNYQILSKLGTGGMGAVYLAEHPLIGKKVALKVIHRELAGNREVVQRFFQEARAVNTIGHENIVEIHDFGQTPEGDHFYIMEYLDGLTLASVISRARRLDVVRALHIAAQIASGLAAAHACGVIHRDLKPDNIMLTMRQGNPDFVKILDFGLAKMFSSGNAPLTALGVVLGTPQYMSPEACESKRDVDHRTDVYAVGVLLFQMLTGQLPFDGASMGEVLVKQVTQLPPAPRGFNPDIPPSVEQIVLRCLAKAPDGRFATMVALRDALLSPESYLASSPPMAAARSLAPGEAPDAKTMLAHLAPRARTSDPIPRPGTDRRRPSAPGGDPDGSAGGAEARGPRGIDRVGMGAAKTVALSGDALLPTAQQPVTSSAQVRAAASAASQARTMIATAAPGRAGQAEVVTMGSVWNGPPTGPGGLGSPTGSNPIVPPVIENRTMLIATPLGYSSAPPRRSWRLITAVAAVSLIVGTTVLVLARHPRAPSRGGSPSRVALPVALDVDAGAVPAVAPRDAAPPPRPVDAGVAQVAVDASAGAAAPAATEVTIDSIPPGATIWIAGQERGQAPLTLQVDRSTTKVTIEARKPGYTTKRQTLVLEGKMSVQFHLEKVRRDRPRPRPGNDLMRP